MSRNSSAAAAMTWDPAQATVEHDHRALAEQLHHCHPRHSPWQALLGCGERALAFAARRAISLLLLALVLSVFSHL